MGCAENASGRAGAAPSAETPGHQLDALLSGKRLSRRHPVGMRVRIKAVRREFEAYARDLSEGGVLVELSHDELAGVEDVELGATDQLELIETHFRDAFDVQFDEQGVVCEARLVRMSVRQEAARAIFLGCQFAYPLSPELQGKLGIGAHVRVATWEQVPELAKLPFEGSPATPAYAFIFDERRSVDGPSYMGQVIRIGRGALVARLENVDRNDVARDLAGEDVRVRVMHGQAVAWEITSALLSTRFLDGRRQGVDVALSTPHAPKRRLLRLFRKRRAA